ncbi:hypothetical protein MKW98_019121 [Papaver atlanticum]|uniref:F-box domain-containing protein n=1 Tax=Papaver atlanticum TaxID=357466 RepID=A0AAD4TMF7_9MAGN|nr:hypothetical protein MKW98_019121 [Papaver atlanticum]
MADHNLLNSLPQEIILNILSRLPAQSVLDCRQVCRSWGNLLQFHRQYVADSETMSFLGFDSRAQALRYLEYNDDKQPNYCVKIIKFKFPASVCGGLVGSDNGLICLSVKTKYNANPVFGNKYKVDTPDEPLYICNPITREFVNLPPLLIDEKKSVDGVHVVHGFGYHPLTNKYKVVRIFYVGNGKSPSFKGQVEVYTVGSGSGWRSAGETNYSLGSDYFANPTGVCVNGTLHWLSDKFRDIVAFDLVYEKFHLLRTTTAWKRCPRRIFVARHCLCLEYIYGNSLDYLLLKKNKEEEDSSCYHMNEQRYYISWSWIEEVTMPSNVVSRIRSSICSITKMGELLLTDGRKVDPCEKVVLEFIGKRFDFDWKIPLSHINTFVSLEALGETTVQRLDS